MRILALLLLAIVNCPPESLSQRTSRALSGEFPSLRDNPFLDLADLGLSSRPRVYESIGPEALVRGLQGLEEHGVRFLVVRTDVPYPDARVRGAAVARLLEDAVGLRPLATQPRVYELGHVERLAHPELLFLTDLAKVRPE